MLASKLKGVMELLGFRVEPILDLFELMGENYEPLARLNYDLAHTGFSLIEDLKLPGLVPIRRKVLASSAEIFLILSWATSLAALFALGIHRTRPTVAKLHVHHRNERVLSRLYEPADLLFTESLLANEKGMAYGIDPGKMLYLPNHYPACCEQIKPSRRYVEKLAIRQKKSIRLKTVVIGVVSRLDYGKNCEFALECVRQLVAKGRDLCLVLKGDFPEESPYPEYRHRFSKMLAAYASEPWFLWDRQPTAFPQVLYEYASFNICLHLSGAEGGSQVVVEYLGLGKPVVLLDGTNNPYLYREAALFVKTTTKMRRALLPFHVPDREDLIEKLDELVMDSKRRAALAQQARVLAKIRFHPKNTEERMRLLIEAARRPKAFGKEIEALYDLDRKLYGIE